MKQITRSIYEVKANEEVTIEIEATKVGNFCTFALDGASIKPVPNSSPLTYKFLVSIAAGLTHFGLFNCNFSDDAPDDAKFQLFISGNKGGSRFKGSNVIKTDSSTKLSIEFRHL